MDNVEMAHLDRKTQKQAERASAKYFTAMAQIVQRANGEAMDFDFVKSSVQSTAART